MRKNDLNPRYGFKKLHKKGKTWIALGAAFGALNLALFLYGTSINTQASPDNSSNSALLASELSPDNVLKDAKVKVTNFEAGTQFTGDKTVDGKLDTHWGTAHNVKNATLTAEMSEVKTIQKINLFWELRDKSGTPDPNISSWKLSVSKQSADDPKAKWDVVETFKGTPKTEQFVALNEPTEVKSIKLEVLDALPGTMNWANIGLREIEAIKATDAQTTNVLKNSIATVSNVESGTNNKGELAVDGKLDTRWSTSVANNKEQYIILDTKNPVDIKRFKVIWEDRQVNGKSDANIEAWKLFYDKSGATKVDDASWTEAYSFDGTPVQSTNVNLKEAINTRFIKLVVSKYRAGSIGWQNVSLAELQAFSDNTSSENEVPKQDLNNISKLSIKDGKVVLPALEGNVEITGTGFYNVVDKQGKIIEPLTDMNVPIMLKQTKPDNSVVTKEVTVEVPGKYKDEGVGEKPTVVPVVQQWHGEEGKYTIDASTSIVNNADFSAAINEYLTDLKAKNINLKTSDAATSNSIVFKKDTTLGLGKEGYQIEIKDSGIVIKAEANDGAIFAIRTLEQMGEKDLQNGIIRDAPQVEIRTFLLDTARKFVPYEQVMNMMKNMSYYKMNNLQLHLSDNFIFLDEHVKGKNLTDEEKIQYVLDHAEEGFRLPSAIKNETTGITLQSEDHYTAEQMQTMINYGKKIGVKLVPEIDTPGHAMPLIRVRPDLQYKGKQLNSARGVVERAAMLDLSDEKRPAVMEFIKEIWNEALAGPLKGVDTVHIGTDEYYGNTEDYRAYINDMLHFLRDEKGLKVMLWGSDSYKNGSTPIDWNGTIIDDWNTGWENPRQAIAKNKKIINIIDSATYMVPSGKGNRGGYGDFLNLPTVYSNWAPSNFNISGAGSFGASNPNIVGGGFAIWNDNTDLHETGMTSPDLFNRFFDALPVFATKTWGSPRNPGKYTEFTRLSDDLKYNPQTNPEAKVSKDKLFSVTAKTLNKFKAENVSKVGNILKFTKDSSITTGVDQIGMPATLTAKVKVTGEGEQVLSSFGKNKIYLSDKDGKVAYDFEHLHIQFDVSLEKNKEYTLTFATKNQETTLLVNGKPVKRLADSKYPQLAYTSFIIPTKTIGGFTGELRSFSLRDELYVDPTILTKDDILEMSASSEEAAHDNQLEKAFDNDKSTNWHSSWSVKDPEYTVNLKFKNKEKLDSFGYLPRQDSSSNGIITGYKLYTTVDGQEQLVKEGTWANNHSLKEIDLNGLSTDNLKLVITKGEGGFASAAEFIIRRASTESEKPVVNSDKLQATIKDAKKYKEADYTKESFDSLKSVLSDAEAILADENSTQAELDEAVADLQAAIKALVKKGGNSGGGNSGNNNGGNSGNNNSGNEQKPNKPETSPDSSIEKVTAVGTIDYVPGYGVLLRDKNGKIPKTKQYLQHGTSWKVNAKKVINGVTYYRLGNDNQWIEGKYLNLNDGSITKLSEVGKVVYHGKGGVLLLNKDGKIPAKRQYLKNNTSWKVNAKTTVNGRTLYRLGTNDQWIPAEYLKL